MILLDGAALARARLPGLRERAAAVSRARGRAPRLALLAFADADGDAPWVERKVHACRRAGVEPLARVVSADAGTTDAIKALATLIAAEAPDAVFVEFPFPEGVDGDALCAAIPVATDIDVMSPTAVADYLARDDAAPPLTVAAILALLDEGGVSLDGRRGAVVGPDIPYHTMLITALARRGVRVDARVDADAVGLADRVGAADLVVLSAGQPGLVPTTWFAPGATVVDAGYFNAGGRGDLDVAPGTAHLGALAPVPGGVGPMTVSALVERVIERAELASD